MRRRTALVAVASILLLLALASDPAAALPPADQAPWTSSAPPPQGLAPEQLSPPDTLDALNQNADLVEAEAVSYASLRVAGSTLRPRSDNVSYEVAGAGGCTYATAGSSYTVWNTPLYLPQSSTINYVRMYYHDESASDNAYAWLTVYDQWGDIVQEWTIQSSNATGNGYADSAAINHVVDYEQYSYALNWRPLVLGETMQLCGFRVFYTPPPFGISFLPYVGH